MWFLPGETTVSPHPVRRDPVLLGGPYQRDEEGDGLVSDRPSLLSSFVSVVPPAQIPTRWSSSVS